MLNPGCEPDIVFMENRGPLHGRAVQHLAIAAVTNLGVNRIGADVVAHRTAMAAGSVLRGKAFVVRCPYVHKLASQVRLLRHWIDFACSPGNGIIEITQSLVSLLFFYPYRLSKPAR